MLRDIEPQYRDSTVFKGLAASGPTCVSGPLLVNTNTQDGDLTLVD